MQLGTAIDYVDVICSDGPAGNSLDGLTFQNGTKFLTIMDGISDLFTAQVITSDAITYLPNTCLNGIFSFSLFNTLINVFRTVETDSNGLTTIWTTTTNKTNNTVIPVCLTVTDTGSVVALPPPAKTVSKEDGELQPVDPILYEKQVKQQQWRFTCTSKGGSVEINGIKHLKSAMFQIQSHYSQSYLCIDQTGLEVVLDCTAQVWTCNMQIVAPSSFTYLCNPWTLSTASRDQQIVPWISSPGSQPLTWSISPPLPPGLQLVGMGLKAGSITTVPMMAPMESSATAYSVTARININEQIFSSSAQVTIEVNSPTHLDLNDMTRQALPTRPSRSTPPAFFAKVAVPSLAIAADPISDLFEFFQPTADFASHPVTTMIINFLESRISGTWPISLSSSKSFQDTFFPGFQQTSPDLSSVVSWDYDRFCKALVAKAITNRAPNVRVCIAIFTYGF